jgi:hypothetical protein
MKTTEDDLVAIILPHVLENCSNKRYDFLQYWADDVADTVWIVVDALMKQRAGHFTPEK